MNVIFVLLHSIYYMHASTPEFMSMWSFSMSRNGMSLPSPWILQVLQSNCLFLCFLLLHCISCFAFVEKDRVPPWRYWFLQRRRSMACSRTIIGFEISSSNPRSSARSESPAILDRMQQAGSRIDRYRFERSVALARIFRIQALFMIFYTYC